MAEIKVDQVTGSNAADVNVSAADAAAADAAAADTTPSAESLGVTPEQFAKFHKDGVYNWEGHSKELEFRAAQKDDGAADADAPAAGDVDPSAAVADAGLDWDELETQVVATGDIDAKSYQALKDIGIPEQFVKDYIETVTRQADSHVADVMAAFGGEAGFDKVKTYAQANYTAAEMDEIDIKLSHPTTYKLAADQLMASAGVVATRAGAPVTSPNALGGGSDGVKGYESEAAMIADMRSPKYKTDPAFRQEVTKKAAAATYGSNNPRAHSGGL